MNRRLTTASLVLIIASAGAAFAFGPFQDQPSGPRALPGDNLPPFGMIDAQGAIPGPPALPPGIALPQPGGPPESTAPGPRLVDAVAIARRAVETCAKRGFRVGATVVDSAGEARAMLTADGSDGSHVFVAMRKAEVALAFGLPSSQAAEQVRSKPALMHNVTPAMFVEGGAVPLYRSGKLIGAVGVSGAAGEPIGRLDEICAQLAAGASAVKG